MSVMLEHLEAVTYALKARQGFATYRDGQEVFQLFNFLTVLASIFFCPFKSHFI